MDTEILQTQIRLWVETRLGKEAMNPHERGMRSHEESTELFQALGGTREEAHRIVDHVFDKEPGVISQELGGAALTLIAAAEGCSYNLGACANAELYRIFSLPMEKFQKRQEQNVADGIGLERKGVL